MKGLIYKDLLWHRKMLIALALMGVCISCIMFMPLSEEALFVYTLLTILTDCILFFLMGLFEQSIFEGDEETKWQTYVVATPMTVRGQVLEKYSFVLGCSILVTLWSLICHVGSACIQHMALNGLFLPLIFMMIQLLLRAFEMPFIVRFGTKYGHYYRIGIGIIVGFLISYYLLFGDLLVFSNWELLLAKILAFCNTRSFEKSGLVIGSILVTGTCYFISYKLSCRIYQKNIDG